MSDLISKSAAQAIPPLPKCYREYATSNLDDAYDKGWEDALFSLNALPTIDSVPVVRCKDCVYWRHDDCQNDNHGYCPINENDFCSWGSERKGGEADG